MIGKLTFFKHGLETLRGARARCPACDRSGLGIMKKTTQDYLRCKYCKTVFAVSQLSVEFIECEQEVLTTDWVKNELKRARGVE